MTRILLIRHAVTEVMREKLCGRLPGISLSAEGHIQAAALAQGLQSRPIDALYCSPLERASETAQYLAYGRVVPQPDERLNELDFGEWTGKTFAELEGYELWHDYNRQRSTTPPPGGEQPSEALLRACEAVDHLAGKHPGETIAMVTHADIIRSLLTHLLGMPLDHLLRFEIAPASVTELSLDCGQVTVHLLNRIFEQQF